MSHKGYDMTGLVARLVRIVGEENIATDEPMSRHTTFEVGGPADVFVTPVTAEQLVDVLATCREAGAPVFVMGNGSNLLVADEGYRGVVVCTAGALDNAGVDGRTMRCEAGAPRSVSATARFSSSTPSPVAEDTATAGAESSRAMAAAAAHVAAPSASVQTAARSWARQ